MRFKHADGRDAAGQTDGRAMICCGVSARRVTLVAMRAIATIAVATCLLIALNIYM